jgi:hypothetical protein
MVLNPRDILSSSQNHQVISFPCSRVGTPMRERRDENQVLCYMEFSTNSTVLALPLILVRLLQEGHEGVKGHATQRRLRWN